MRKRLGDVLVSVMASRIGLGVRVGRDEPQVRKAGPKGPWIACQRMEIAKVNHSDDKANRCKLGQDGDKRGHGTPEGVHSFDQSVRFIVDR